VLIPARINAVTGPGLRWRFWPVCLHFVKKSGLGVFATGGVGVTEKIDPTQ
jgi:hypothetical protein